MIIGTKTGTHALLTTSVTGITENKIAIPIFKFSSHRNSNVGARQSISHGRLAHLSHAGRVSHNRRASNTQRHSIITIHDPEEEA